MYVFNVFQDMDVLRGNIMFFALSQGIMEWIIPKEMRSCQMRYRAPCSDKLGAFITSLMPRDWLCQAIITDKCFIT